MRSINTYLSAFLLAFIFMLSSFAGRELCKLPILVKHFEDHKQHDRSIGMLHYLVLHYFEEQGNDHDAAEDNQLPFKSTDSVPLSFISIVPPGFINLVSTMHIIHTLPILKRNLFFLPCAFLSKIWQPPRQC